WAACSVSTASMAGTSDRAESCRAGVSPRPSSTCSAALMRSDQSLLPPPDRPRRPRWQIGMTWLVLQGWLRYRAAQIRPHSHFEERAPARRRICHESRNSSGISYDYGRDDRWHRIPDALDLGQAGRQAEPRYRLQVAPGLDRRRPAAARSRRPRVAVPEEVFGLSQEGVKPRERRLIRGRIQNAPVRAGAFLFRPSFRDG